MKLDINAKISISIDPSKMMDVPDEKIEQVIGQIITRFTRWNCDELVIISEGKNNLWCQFIFENKVKLTMGAIWRSTEFTFHT